ncbi:MAG TPA: nuclear transport factor 2 family protein, partial [Anaeromyxobacteraceae bacterium]|nr:nuclear transport factor 2 family protein [Anaeromyxobacteraceae bacterium]
MRAVALTVTAVLALVPVAAFAQGSSGSSQSKSKSQGQAQSSSQPQAKDMQSDPMAGWTPPKITREAQGRKEILAMFQRMEDAGRKGDVEAAAALVDFPVMMITDDKTGEAMGQPWSREQWMQVMGPFYEKPMKDMKVTHKPTIFFLSDSLASVDDQWTMTHGKQKMSGRSSSILIRTGGEWKLKSMVEGGWGDMPMPEGTTTGTGTGTSGSMGSTGSTGSTGDTG